VLRELSAPGDVFSNTHRYVAKNHTIKEAAPRGLSQGPSRQWTRVTPRAEQKGEHMYKGQGAFTLLPSGFYSLAMASNCHVFPGPSLFLIGHFMAVTISYSTSDIVGVGVKYVWGIY
jgi:hypothetical protein